MTFNVSDPAPSDKIRNWPSSVTTNEWPRLRDMIEADHVFNNAAGGAPDTSGWHKVVRWINQGAAPAAITSHGQLYTKTAQGLSGTDGEHLAYLSGTNPATYPESILSLFPIRAAAIFDGGTLAFTGTPYNFNAVLSPSAGVYTMAFTAALPSANYFVCAFQNGTVDRWAQFNSPTTAGFQIRSFGFGGGPANMTQCRVLVFGG